MYDTPVLPLRSPKELALRIGKRLLVQKYGYLDEDLPGLAGLIRVNWKFDVRWPFPEITLLCQ